jgi:hypothetical protein
MKSKLFVMFGLGALTATISLGAIQIASASSDSTVTACANKKTGAMRSITKGKCNKTERTMRWNQQGPQGLSGAKGDLGSTGPKGETGNTGATGNFLVKDATGTTIGKMISYRPSENPGSGEIEDTVIVLSQGRLWNLRVQKTGFLSTSGSISPEQYGGYYDSSNGSTRKPYGKSAASGSLSPNGTLAHNNKVYIPSSSPFSPTSVPVFEFNGSELSSGAKSTLALSTHLFRLEEITPLSYVAPLVIAEG